MALILTNAFRLLGLPATAAPRETRRVIDELAVLSSLGRDAALDPEVLSQIRQTLDDPVERLRAELYWFHSPPDVVDPKIDLASEVAVGATVGRLQAIAGRGVTREQAIALHDLAVVKYAHDVDSGQSVDESSALAGWTEVWASAEFWTYMAERAHEAHDARLTEAFLGELRNGLPAAVLEPVGTRGSSLLDAGDVSRASVAVRAVRRSGMPEIAVEVAARQAVSPLRAQVEAGIKDMNGISATLSASAGDTRANRLAFRSARSVLTTEVLAPYHRLRTVDPLCEPTLGDKVAAEVRGLGVSAYNVLEDWEKAYLLARLAFSLGRTAETLRSLARDQATAARTYHEDQANRATAAKRYLQVVAHLELAASYAEDDDDRQRLLEFARGAAAQSRLSADVVASAKTSISETLDRQLAALEQEIETADRRGPDEKLSAEPVKPRTFEPRRSTPPPPSAKSPARRVALVAVAAVIVFGGLYGIAVAFGSEPASTPPSFTSRSSDQSTGLNPPAPASRPASQTSTSQPPSTSSAPPKGRAACLHVPILESALATLEQKVEARRRAVRDYDAQGASSKVSFKAFLAQHPEQYLSSTDYATYQRLRANYRAYEAGHNKLVRQTNALIGAYNSKLRRIRQLRREC